MSLIKYFTFGLSLALLAGWRVIDCSLIDDVPTRREERALPGRLVQETQDRTSYRLRYIPASRSPNQRTDTVMLRTFELAIGQSWKATVQIISGRDQLALGTIVGADGWILTKASQLSHGELQCRFFDGKKAAAKIVRIQDNYDLALLKVERRDLPVMPLKSDDLPSVGAWLATTSTSLTPLGIGVVSVGPRAISSQPPVLGIKLGDAEEGALVSEVVDGGGAQRAGIEPDDIIISVDKTYIANKQALLDKIKTLRAGQRVSIIVQRGEDSQTIEAQLMDMSTSLFDATEMEVTGSVSARSTGFARAFQHDTVLAPHQCGGPLIDSRGRIVGINIARAGRVSSYALPMDVVVPAIREMMGSNSIPVSAPSP